MAKKETKKPSTNEVVEEFVETVDNEVETAKEVTEETPVVEEAPIEEPVVEETPAGAPVEDVWDWNKDYTGKFTPDEDGRVIELIVPDGMMGRVTTLLGEHDLIITLTADDKATVGPFSGDKFNEAVRLVAGCGVMYRI